MNKHIWHGPPTAKQHLKSLFINLHLTNQNYDWFSDTTADIDVIRSVQQNSTIANRPGKVYTDLPLNNPIKLTISSLICRDFVCY